MKARQHWEFLVVGTLWHPQTEHSSSAQWPCPAIDVICGVNSASAGGGRSNCSIQSQDGRTSPPQEICLFSEMKHREMSSPGLHKKTYGGHCSRPRPLQYFGRNHHRKCIVFLGTDKATKPRSLHSADME